MPRWKAVDLGEVTEIGVDESAAKRGHDYIALFMERGKRRMMYAVAGRDRATVGAFKAILRAHGGDSVKIQEACIDMSKAFNKGFADAFPNTHLSEISNGPRRSINSTFHAVKAMARGYRATRYLIAVADLPAGKLEFIPSYP